MEDIIRSRYMKPCTQSMSTEKVVLLPLLQVNLGIGTWGGPNTQSMAITREMVWERLRIGLPPHTPAY